MPKVRPPKADHHHVNIKSTGIHHSLKIDGKDFSDVAGEVSLGIASGKIAVVTVSLGLMPISYVGEAQITWAAADGTAISYVEFADGSSFGKPR
jgi:hypothetical protein